MDLDNVILIHNCSGKNFWEKIYNEDLDKICLYEGRHGKYVGEIINDEIFDTMSGRYIGEIFFGRLVVDKNKVNNLKIKGNFMFCPFGRMGRVFVADEEKIEVPKGYEDFLVGAI